MKKIITLFLALTISLIAGAQQKNILLDQGFWKKKPDVATVKDEIAKGNNASELNERAFDPVVFAINNDAPNETIKFLLEQPGNTVTKATHDNRRYLHWAANKGNLEIVNFLIAKGADINYEDSIGATALVFAASSGQKNTEVYEAFFKAGLDPKKKYKDGMTLLLMAIPYDKDLALTEYLSSKGLSIKDTDSNGNTAFNLATKTGDLKLLNKLIEKGVKYTDGALIFAAQGNRRETTSLEVYQYLIEQLKLKPTVVSNEGESVLHFLVTKAKQTDIINYLISKGADVNKADKNGNTVLMKAATAKDTEALELLMNSVKNSTAVNTKGESALTMAVQFGSTKAVELLLKKGLDSKISNKEGYNLGYYLIQSYRPEANRAPESSSNSQPEDPFTSKMKLLQDSGLNLSVAQKEGSTLYHFALLKNDLNLLQKISNLNIDINAKNKEGLTALHKAAMVAKNDTILKYLLSIGAKKDSVTEFNETAYSLAKENETLSKNNISIDFLK